MPEHGALTRKLVVYREVTDRLTAGHNLLVHSLHQAARRVYGTVMSAGCSAPWGMSMRSSPVRSARKIT